MVDSTVLEALEMTATMATCLLKYRYRFPWIGHQFEKGWMKEVHGDTGDMAERNIVYLCIQPAVFSQGSSSDALREVVVSPALVVAERLATCSILKRTS